MKRSHENSVSLITDIFLRVLAGSPSLCSFAKDIDAQPVPPIWPPGPSMLVVDDFVYEVACVPLSSIALVTNKTVKVGIPLFGWPVRQWSLLQVDVNEIAERHKITPMKQAVGQLDGIAREWANFGQIPEVEWSRMRSLEFQETLRSRNELRQKLSGKKCLECEQFKSHVSQIHRRIVDSVHQLTSLLASMLYYMARCYLGRIFSSSSSQFQIRT